MQIDTRSPRATSAALKEGMKATFTVDAFPGKTFEGNGPPGAQLADDDAGRRHLRRGDRRRQHGRSRCAPA